MMLEFCPACEKNGYKKKIILLQINLQEALWLCESSECAWPFGYEEFTFVSRKIGTLWTADSEIQKPTIQANDSNGISLSKLGLYTPPVTPGSGSGEILSKDLLTNDSCLGINYNMNAEKINDVKVTKKQKQVSPISQNSYARQEVHNSKSSNIVREKSVECLENSDKEKLTPNTSSNELNDAKLSSMHSIFNPSDDEISDNIQESVFSSSKPKCKLTSLRDGHLNISSLEFNELEAQNHSNPTVLKCAKWLDTDSGNDIRKDDSELQEKLVDEVQPATTFGSVPLLEDDCGITTLPRIKSIEKSDLDIKNVKNGIILHEICSQSRDSTTLKEKKKIHNDDTSKNINNVCLNIVDTNSTVPIICVKPKNAKSVSKVENRILKLADLPPINLSYEIPDFLEVNVETAPLNKTTNQSNVDSDSQNEPNNPSVESKNVNKIVAETSIANHQTTNMTKINGNSQSEMVNSCNTTVNVDPKFQIADLNENRCSIENDGDSNSKNVKLNTPKEKTASNYDFKSDIVNSVKTRHVMAINVKRESKTTNLEKTSNVGKFNINGKCKVINSKNISLNARSNNMIPKIENSSVGMKLDISSVNTIKYMSGNDTIKLSTMKDRNSDNMNRKPVILNSVSEKLINEPINESNRSIGFGAAAMVENTMNTPRDLTSETTNIMGPSQRTSDSKLRDEKPLKKQTKRPLVRSRKYEGFSFGLLSKKARSDENHMADIRSPDAASTCSDISHISEGSSSTTDRGIDCSHGSVLKNVNSPDSGTSSPGKPSLEKELNSNLDMILDDFIYNDSKELAQVLDDSWLLSLFN